MAVQFNKTHFNQNVSSTPWIAIFPCNANTSESRADSSDLISDAQKLGAHAILYQAYSSVESQYSFCNLTDNTPPVTIPIYITETWQSGPTVFSERLGDLFAPSKIKFYHATTMNSLAANITNDFSALRADGSTLTQTDAILARISAISTNASVVASTASPTPTTTKTPSSAVRTADIPRSLVENSSAYFNLSGKFSLDWNKLGRALKTALEHMFSSPRLESVHLRGIVVQSPTQLLFFFSEATSLKELSLSRVGCTQRPGQGKFKPWPQSQPWRPQLQSILVADIIGHSFCRCILNPQIDLMRLRSLTLVTEMGECLDEMLQVANSSGVEHLRVEWFDNLFNCTDGPQERWGHVHVKAHAQDINAVGSKFDEEAHIARSTSAAVTLNDNKHKVSAHNVTPLQYRVKEDVSNDEDFKGAQE
ncbi:hypothetical protein C8R44DRAFT_856642 [Mycena epipterygia]|nr:hypothetical protein C8R44DRAFT_856642 [Mycena epipterygia]